MSSKRLREDPGAMARDAKMQRTASNWVPVLAGQLRASGAPGASSFAKMVRETDTTHIITLLNDSELETRRLGDWCHQHGVGWTHIPLSGANLACENDHVQLRRLVEIRLLLEAGSRVLIHCSAGMHRTGIAMYIVLRHCGLSPSQALTAVHESRLATYEELIAPRKKLEGRRLADLAEDNFRVADLPENTAVLMPKMETCCLCLSTVLGHLMKSSQR